MLRVPCFRIINGYIETEGKPHIWLVCENQPDVGMGKLSTFPFTMLNGEILQLRIGSKSYIW